MKSLGRLKKRPPINTWMLMIYLLFGIYAYANASRVINEMFILITLVAIGDGIYFALASRKVKVEIYASESVEKKADFRLSVKLCNEGSLITPYIFLVPQSGKRAALLEEHQIGLMLGGKEVIVEDILFHAHFCGLEHIGLSQIVFRSFLGFYRKEKKLLEDCKIKILPEIRPLSGLQYFSEALRALDTGGGMLNNEEHMLGTGDDVGYELRPYVEGDSRRLIHWKIAAYKDELLVRQRQQEQDRKSDLFFILNPFISEIGDQEVFLQDKLLTTFISLVSYYINLNQKVRVAYYKNKSWQYAKLSGERQVRFLQESLGDYTGLKVEKTMNQRSIIRSFIKMAHRRGGVKVVISAYWSYEMEKYVFEQQNITNLTSVWVGGNRPEWETSLSMWHMTDKYTLASPVEKFYIRNSN